MARDKRTIPQLIQDIGKPGSTTVEQDKQALKERINKASSDELAYLYNHSNYQSYIKPLLKSIGVDDDKIEMFDDAYSTNLAIKETKEGNPDALKAVSNDSIKSGMEQASRENRTKQAMDSEEADKLHNAGNTKVDRAQMNQDEPLSENDRLRLYDDSLTDEDIKEGKRGLGLLDSEPKGNGGIGNKVSTKGEAQSEIEKNGNESESENGGTEDSTVETPKDESQIEENSESKSSEDKKLLNKLFSAWKEGKLDMYPSMKALTDTIAKKAKMGQDRANILTGKGSDTSVYDPITTEMDKERDLMREETSSFDAKTMNAKKWSEMSQTEKEDWMKMANQNGVDMETLLTQIQDLGGNIEKNTQYIENLYKQQQDETTKGAIEVSQMNQQMKATATSNLAALQQRRVELEQLKANLAGNDWDAYAKAMNAYVGTSKGLQSVGAVNTTQSQDGKSFTDSLSTDVGTGKIPSAFVRGGVSNNSTWANSSSSSTSNTGSLSTDALAYSRFPNGEKYAMATMEEKNAANEELRKSIDNQIAIIDKCIESWSKDLGL